MTDILSKHADLFALLKKGLLAMKIAVTPNQYEQLITYIEMLYKWNERFNLTAVRSIEEMVKRHLLDSLSIIPYLLGDRLIDVGTGPGLPGIPLSILCPNKIFFLLDSNQKKQVFVSQVTKVLALENVQCIHSTVQAYQPTLKFSTILTRAFAPLERMIALTTHLLAEEGRWLAMMGKIEDLKLPDEVQLEEIKILKVPFEKAERHLAIITK